MPSPHQQQSLQTLLGLFLEAQGSPLPQRSQLKSPSALSRFLNHYHWNTRQVIRAVRKELLHQLLHYAPRGRRPRLQLIVDLTTLEKCGQFQEFAPLISVLNGKRGLHIVVLYLVVGQWRMPWSFRVWRGKGKPSPAQLAIRLIDALPKTLLKAYRITVLADTAFGSCRFITAMKRRRLPLIVGVKCSRHLHDGRPLTALVRQGQSVRLAGLSFDVYVAWFYLKRNGKLEQRFVISTRRLKGSSIVWWGRRRWSIEGFFKTAKHRFGLHRFGQKTLRGVYRWLVLSLISFVLAHWSMLSTGSRGQPSWGEGAVLALEKLLPEVLLCQVLRMVEATRSLFADLGFELRLIPSTS